MTRARHRIAGPASGTDRNWAGLERALNGVLSQPNNGVARDDPFRALTMITDCAVRYLPGVDHAGITVVDADGVIRSVAPTDGYPLVLDNIERRFVEGPCYEAAAAKQTLRVDDLTRERRWPSFIKRTLDSTPVRAVLALPIFDEDGAHAALNLYADDVGAMDGETLDGGSLVAQYLARAMTTRRHRKPLRTLATGADAISAAKRLLMQRFAIDAVEALTLLVRTSRLQGISMQTLSLRLVEAQQQRESSNLP
jgi:GAF domain